MSELRDLSEALRAATKASSACSAPRSSKALCEHVVVTITNLAKVLDAASIEDPDIRRRDCAEHLSAALITLSAAVRIIGAPRNVR